MAEPLGQAEVRRALAEDLASGDVTTRLLGAAAKRAAALRFVAEAPFVVAGLPLVELTFKELDHDAQLEIQVPDGSRADQGAIVATARGTAAALLSGERVALNFLQRLSGIATLTRRAVDAVAGTGARITHTRKTTPGLRALECYAVRTGGGVDNRASLADVVMWKDNHWALLDGGGAGLAQALKAVPPGLPVIVEVENEPQLDAALAAGVNHLLVDNQTPERLGAWARRAGPGITIQASGGIRADTARAYAEAGAALIAIGALTHSAPAALIRCELD